MNDDYKTDDLIFNTDSKEFNLLEYVTQRKVKARKTRDKIIALVVIVVAIRIIIQILVEIYLVKNGG